jgi:hypothetical protein
LFFNSRSSTIKIDPSVTLSLDSVIDAYDGTLVRAVGGTITGQNISFLEGVFEDAGNELFLTGVFNPLGQLLLNGNSFVRGEPGQILQNVLVTGANNKLSGQPTFSSDIVLQDSDTTLNVELQSAVNNNIQLNGGRIILDDDLAFVDQRMPVGTGIITGDGHTVSTGGTPFTWTTNLTFDTDANLELHTQVDLDGSLTFTGINTINGHGNVFDITEGSINIAPGSTLYLTDVMLRGLGTGAGNLMFGDIASTAVLSNVTLELIAPFATPQGNIYVQGPGTWVLKDNNWNFGSDGMVTVDGVTLFTDQAGALNLGNLIFANPNTQLSFVNDGRICEVICTPTVVINIDSRIEQLETCCEILQSQIDVLESCCETIQTDTTLVSRVEVLETCCDLLTSEVDVLESCCDELRSIIDTIDTGTSGGLFSRIEVLCELIGCECTILVTNTVAFDLSMLPGEDEAVIFKFDPCFAPCDQKPVLVFDPAQYGNAGLVELPAGSRMIFTGEGIVELRDGVEFNMAGTPHCLDPNPPVNPKADWPCLVVENNAIMHVDLDATVAIGGGLSSNPGGPGGAGRVIVRNGGTILLDQTSHLIFGNTNEDDLEISAEFVGAIITNAPRALITFQKACFELLFNHQSALSILQGTVEMNMYGGAFNDPQGNEATGVIKRLFFDEGSLLYVLRRGSDVGLLRMAPNFNPDANFALGADIPMEFNNRCGQACGGGWIQFKEFAGISVSLGNHFFEQGTVLGAGTVMPVGTIFTGQTLFDGFTLTADTLIPAGSVFAAGSVINGVPTVIPVVVNVDTVYLRGITFLATGSTIAAYATTTSPLTSALLIPPRSHVPTGTIISPTSERVNSILNLQGNNFDLLATPVNIFMELSYLTPNAPTPDGAILVNLGSLEPGQDGRLAALCPPARNGVQRDGSVVGLQAGDHDVQYNASVGSQVLNQIIGFTFTGQQFTIDNCDEATRTET